MWGDDDLRADEEQLLKHSEHLHVVKDECSFFSLPEERLAQPGDCPQCLSSAVPCYCEMSAIVGVEEEDTDEPA